MVDVIVVVDVITHYQPRYIAYKIQTSKFHIISINIRYCDNLCFRVFKLKLKLKEYYSSFVLIPKTTMTSNDSDDDRKERDKFAERLKQRDKERTRNIAIPRSGTQ